MKIIWLLLMFSFVLCGRPAVTPSTCKANSLLQLQFQWTKSSSHIAQRRHLGRKMLDFEGPVDAEVENYAKNYHKQLSQSSRILYQHVSKSAGTMLCQVGRTNGCKTASNNCHIDPLDGPAWIGGDYGKKSQQSFFETCSSMSAKYAAANVTLEGNEALGRIEGHCPDSWNVIILREPITRLISHLNMLSRWFQGSEWTTPSLASVHTYYPAIVDNFFIRSILGLHVYSLPVGSINVTHLEAATRVLESFDVVLVVDEDNMTFLEDNVHATLGFDVEKKHDRRHYSTLWEFKKNLTWTSAEWENLEEANSLDKELWERAKVLNDIDNRIFMHPKFSHVSATMPRATCGYLAK